MKKRAISSFDCFIYTWLGLKQFAFAFATIQVNLDMTDSMGPGPENWSIIGKIRRIHMANTWYASDWDQAYRPSHAKICRIVVRHIQVHL